MLELVKLFEDEVVERSEAVDEVVQLKSVADGCRR